MSKMTEYIDAAIGYDASGHPASTTQFTFGIAPFSIAETEDISDLAEITVVCQTDAVVDIQVIDNTAMVSFDFSMETDTLVEISQELISYNDQKQHVTESLNRLMAELDVAQRNEDEKRIDELQVQIRSLTVPFMLPTIMPVCYDGTVHIGFFDDPKFVFFTSDQLNQQPYKVTMIFEVKDVFCQDEVETYSLDPEDEIRAQQEELWYLEEAKKAEEEEYRSQYGYDIYDDSTYEDENTDKRLKGVRIK